MLRQKEELCVNYQNQIFEQEKRLAKINHIIKNINTTYELDSLTKFVCAEIKKISNADFCAILRFNKISKKFEITKCLSNVSNKTSLKNFRLDLEKYTSFVNKTIEKRTKKQNELIKNYIQEFDSNKYAYPIISNDGTLVVVYIFSQIPINEKCDINAIDIICDNYRLAFDNLKLYKQLEETSKHKTEFIANVTHEFKTPLNAIIGFAELLKSDTIEKKKSNHYIDNIVTNSHHLLKLIEDILDISKIELNSLDLIYETGNAKNIIEEVIYILDGVALAKNLEIKSHLLDTLITVDKKRYKQIIYNLINNAIKFSFENSKIEIFTYSENERFYFEISDTGSGIPKDMRNKIFEMFSQCKQDILKKEKGHGVGLFICKKLVTLHNGEIFCLPNHPCGTTFKFYVPNSLKTN